MADWSDLVSLPLKKARERAERYGYNIAVFRIGEKYMTPEIDRSKPTVMVSINESGEDGIVIATHGIEHPTVS